MNALTRSVIFAPRSALMGQKRMQSATALAVSDKAANKLRKVWVSDKGAYPVMGILAFACVFSAWYGTYNLFTSPDIRMEKGKRYSVLRTWAKGEW